MEELSNKNTTIGEMQISLGDPDVKNKFKALFEQIKDYINRRPRSNKGMIGAGLGTTPSHPLVLKYGGRGFE